MNLLSPDLENIDLTKSMRQALHEAEAAGQAGELPIGAAIVIDGEVISRGRSRAKDLRSQIRHAELNAILEGGEKLWQDYQRAILFTTVERCPLCLGAAVMADIPHIIFALPDKAVYSGQTVASNPYVQSHVKSYCGGLMAEESIAVFVRYDPDALEYIMKGNA